MDEQLQVGICNDGIRIARKHGSGRSRGRNRSFEDISDNNDQFHFDDAHDLDADDIEYETGKVQTQPTGTGVVPETVGSVTHEPPPDASFADFEGNDQQEQNQQPFYDDGIQGMKILLLSLTQRLIPLQISLSLRMKLEIFYSLQHHLLQILLIHSNCFGNSQ